MNAYQLKYCNINNWEFNLGYRVRPKQNTSDYTVYLDTKLYYLIPQDYPSIAHLVQKLSENNIQTIFAVTEEFQPVYKVKRMKVLDLSSCLVISSRIMSLKCRKVLPSSQTKFDKHCLCSF